MVAFYNLFIAMCAIASATVTVERYEIPHWLSLLPEKLDSQLREMQNSSAQKTDENCQKVREEHWDLQMKASEIAEKGGSSDYVDAADKAEAAASRERECRKFNSEAQPLTFSFDLYSAPETKSTRLGKLVIEVRPWVYDEDDATDSQVKTIFVDLENKPLPFTADIPHPFNEKPGVFHTVMAKKGTWYQLPPKPFPQPVWVNFSDHGGGVPLSILKAKRPVFVKTGDAGTYVVFHQRKGRKLMGVESMEDRGKAGKPGKAVEVDLSELFDQNGHIRAKWRADDED